MICPECESEGLIRITDKNIQIIIKSILTQTETFYCKKCKMYLTVPKDKVFDANEMVSIN